jgi:hypothetical protein
LTVSPTSRRLRMVGSGEGMQIWCDERS